MTGPLSDIIGRSVALQPRSGAFLGLCPFHSEATPSFVVNDTAGRFHCLSCSKGGDAADFERHMAARAQPEIGGRS